MGVVGFVILHPSEDFICPAGFEGFGILLADDGHGGFFEGTELGFCGALPEADVEVDAKGFKFWGVGGGLEPDGEGKLSYGVEPIAGTSGGRLASEGGSSI